MERLEDRQLLSVNTIAIQSGQTARFVDADGTRVSVLLTGPGSGTLDLANGQLTGDYIDNLTLHDTTGASQLRISARGGSIPGTKINELVIEKALNEIGALDWLVAPNVDLIVGGHFTADGDVNEIRVRNLDANSQIDVTGNVARLSAKSIQDQASIEISGWLKRFLAESVTSGAKVQADQIDLLSVTKRADSGDFEIGDGGLGEARFRQLKYSMINSQGRIGTIIVAGDMIGTAVSSNISTGSDGTFGTIDDVVTDPNATGDIGFVRVDGKMGWGPGRDSTFVSSDDIGKISYNRNSAGNRRAAPVVWKQAASATIPLNFTTTALAAAGFTNGDIYIAVYGEDVPETSTTTPTGITYYVDPDFVVNGAAQRIAASSLPVSANTPNLAILPSADLTKWGTTLNLPVPASGRKFTGRILISVGAPVQAQVNADGSVGAPSAANQTDPSTGTMYDFLEFTVTNDPTNGQSLDIDTSQVDSFGMPIKLELFQPGGTKFNLSISGDTHATTAQITGIVDTTGLAAGQPIFSSTPNVLPSQGARILSVTPSTATTKGSIIISQDITPSVTGAQFTVHQAGPVGVEAARDIVLDGPSTGSGTSLQLVHFLEGEIDLGSSQARPFLQTAAPYVKTGPVPITTATTGNPIVITADSVDGLSNGAKIWINGVNNTADGFRTVANLNTTAKTFELQGVNGGTAYTQGGTWSMAILTASYDPTHPNDPIAITASNTLGLKDGDIVEVFDCDGNTSANGFFFVSSVSSTSFVLDGSKGNAAYTGGGKWKVYTPSDRLASPADVVEGLESPQDPNLLNNYFNETIDSFFSKYTSTAFTLQSTAYGAGAITYSGTFQNVNISNTNGTSYSGYALKLTAIPPAPKAKPLDPNTYYIVYPFFTSNAPSPDVYTPQFTVSDAPTWLTDNQKQNESASRMIFACDAAFADNGFQGLAGNQSKVQGDLENSIATAFNRGIILNDSNTWDQIGTWFPAGESFNYWVKYWHQLGLMESDLAYAFPYDDKFGTSTNLNQANVGSVGITLGTWSATRTKTTTTFQTFHTSASFQGPIALAAKVVDQNGAAVTTGSVSFFINGVAINSKDSSSAPPFELVSLDTGGVATLNAIVPAMPDGTVPHTYTVTAVYSGDSTHLPSIEHGETQLSAPFTAGFQTGHAAVGGSDTLLLNLPGSAYAGTIDVYISHSDGTGQQHIVTGFSPQSFQPQVSFMVPLDLLTFTGNIVTTGTGKSATTTIENVSSFVDLIPNDQTLSNATYLASDTTFAKYQYAQIRLNNPSSVYGTVNLTINGKIYQADIDQANPHVANGIISLAGLSDGDVVTGPGIPAATKITKLIQGYINIMPKSVSDGSGVTITSNAVGSSPLITVTFKPTNGKEVSLTTSYSITG